MDILDGKSEEEIRRAAMWWFIAAEAYQRGEEVPRGVFLIDVSAKLTPDDIEWAHKMAAEHGWDKE